jgi:Protein of unknown function (DUF742)
VVGQTGARFGGAAGRRSRSAADDDAIEADARLPSLLSRWRHKRDEHDEQAEQNLEQQAAVHTEPQRTPEHRQQPRQPSAPQPEIAMPVPDEMLVPDESAAIDWDTSKEGYDLVRPYSWTGGRTSSRVDLAVETLVSATGRPLDPAARPEHRTILGLCATPHSVAELAALLSMPLGVARVLLGDLAAAGSVAVHRTVGSADTAPDIALMQRVLAGLERL